MIGHWPILIPHGRKNIPSPADKKSDSRKLPFTLTNPVHWLIVVTDLSNNLNLLQRKSLFLRSGWIMIGHWSILIPHGRKNIPSPADKKSDSRKLPFTLKNPVHWLIVVTDLSNHLNLLQREGVFL